MNNKINEKTDYIELALNARRNRRKKIDNPNNKSLGQTFLLWNEECDLIKSALDANINSIDPTLFVKKNKIIMFDNYTIRIAVRLWIENEVEAIRIYGHISNWNTSNVTNMAELFKNASLFNQDITQWDVSGVIKMSYMFLGASTFNQAIGKWDVSKVFDMEGMFDHAVAFNQDIGQWDVSNVFNMKGMFSNAITFNQDIGQWDVLMVNEMIFMFGGAIAFNQYIGKWPINRHCKLQFMFEMSGISEETFEGKLYGNQIAYYFEDNLKNPDEEAVWEPYTRWQRRKNVVMFFSSISKMDITIASQKSIQSNDSEEIIINPVLEALHSLNEDVCRQIVLFI